VAVGLGPLPDLPPIEGVKLASVAAGVRARGRVDLGLIACDAGTRCAAVFTRNAFCAAPVVIARRHLAADTPRALLVNSGNANAGNGAEGEEDALTTCHALAALIDCPVEAVLPYSTGVIGERLPADRITDALPGAVAELSADGWHGLARAIMTTDTAPKGSTRTILLSSGATVRINGVAKGSGMIRPDMATMLAFLATDAAVEQDALDAALRHGVSRSFNRITVDGDTSTNDACTLLATGRARGARIAGDSGADYEAFRDALADVLTELAVAVIRDAEGATKFITLDVTGAATAADALRAGYAVAESPLVKTALFASDPNWGRILAAIGRAGVSGLVAERVVIEINGVRIASAGARDPSYSEERGRAAMAPADIHLHIDLGMGAAAERIWTSDLGYEYVRINAEYRS